MINIYDDNTINDNPNILPWFHCDKIGCNKSYSSLGQLNLHKKSHSKPYKCLYEENNTICNKSFARRTDLKLHLLRIHNHHNENNQNHAKKKCKFCKNTFKSNSSLLKHIENIHVGIQKRFACKRCHKKFRRKDELQSHFKSHLSMDQRKNFKCDQCSSSFTLKTNLKKHLRKFHAMSVLC